MLGLRNLKNSARIPRPLGPLHKATRSYVARSQRGPSKEEPAYDDFRPPWVYTTSHVLTYTTIPRQSLAFIIPVNDPDQILVALIYCVFLADWGDRDHVFMPVREIDQPYTLAKLNLQLRRWALQYKQSFFSLSPEELALVQQRSGSAPKDSQPEQVEGSNS
ncbi:hypothetical protein F5I97DRAFT_1884285 [Phlebopus sp. FC_14]|nr:hypothetical protein F5I97DRAFT_1884285 [Phlebopus sp. FC_14]